MSNSALAAQTAPMVQSILKGYALSPYGLHGVAHWARVLKNGLRLAESTGAIADVVVLFAIFHDSRRVNDGYDPGHGRRGGALAAKMRGRLFDLSDADFNLLFDACARHTDGRTIADVTVQTCWDADRLDLGRCGIEPADDLLCTDAARNAKQYDWACERAEENYQPALIDEWGL